MSSNEAPMPLKKEFDAAVSTINRFVAASGASALLEQDDQGQIHLWLEPELATKAGEMVIELHDNKGTIRRTMVKVVDPKHDSVMAFRLPPGLAVK